VAQSSTVHLYDLAVRFTILSYACFQIILERQPWFLDMLVKMVEQGDLQCDMVPAVSVLDRLVVVILSERLVH